MKNFKSVVIGFCVLVTFVIITLALAIDHFGSLTVERAFWALLSVASWFLSRYFTRMDMYNGAKVVLASQESDDRRERAAMNTLGKFISSIKGGSSPDLPPALTAGQTDSYNVSESDLVFEDADFTFEVDE